MALVLTTNTLHAYNYWGGRSAYCDVGALMSRARQLPQAMAGAIGVLSSQRPFPPMLLAPPADMPRLVNLRKRGFEERTWAGADPAWSRAHGQSPYDGSAGYPAQVGARLRRLGRGRGPRARLSHRLRPRRRAERPGRLRRGGPGRAQRILVRAAARRRSTAFVERGGRLAIFSGNTAFWKVRWEDDGRTMICHKWKGFEADPAAIADPAGARTCGRIRPSPGRRRATTGLSFIFGGYHRLGLCAARGQGGYTVYRDQHWALDGCDLYYGDVFGDEVCRCSATRTTAAASRFDDDGLPAPVPRLGVPDNLEIIALAPASFAEAPGRGYRPLIPPEQLDVVAEIAYGSTLAPRPRRGCCAAMR